MSHIAKLGTDARGNLTRIDNALSAMLDRLNRVKEQLDNFIKQQEAAKSEIGKPFPQEQELKDKISRLAILDAELNIGVGDGYIIHLDLSDIRELVTLLRRTSNSLNQLTKRVHQTGNIYGEDIEILRESYDRLWDIADEILLRLFTI